MVSTDGATRLVGRFIAETPSDSISSDDLATAKLSLIDTAFAFNEAATKAPFSPFLGLNRDEEAGVELCGVRLSAAPVMASLAFGATARSLELDDWAPYGAAGASLWGALLLLAKVDNIADESRLLDAWCVGVRIGVALWTKGRYRQADRGFDGTDIFGSIACAAAGARLLKLDAVQSSAAVAIAVSEMGGLVANLGTDVGIFHAGFAARNGFQAASLARAGIYGALDALEARQGFGEAIFGPADGPLFGLKDELEATARLSDVVRFRRFPCVIEQQRVIATVQALADSKSIPTTEIATVRVEGVPPTSESTRSDIPETSDEARRSLHYVLACLLHHGSITMADFEPSAVTAKGVTDALSRVEVDILQRWDARLLQDNPAEASRVFVTTAAGEELSGDPTTVAGSLDANELFSKWDALINHEGSTTSTWARQTLEAWRSSRDALGDFSVLATFTSE
ncbi:MAG: MmgE/PrpD family protein [Acidimicrobiales bacterium]